MRSVTPGRPAGRSNRPSDQLAGLGAVDQPRKTGLLQAQCLTELCHPDRSSGKDTEELSMLWRQPVATAGFAKHPLYHKAQPYQSSRQVG
jgi:hypothetical protein